jgi:arginyl-tRNA synthetase
MPEDGYHGEDILELAREFANIHGNSYLNIDEIKRKKDLVDFALPINIKNIKKTLSRYRIDYDVWFKESDLHESGEALKAVELLKKNGKTYEKEGALWYKSSDENEKDEVLIRNNGIPTYFAVDIAYHLNKFKSRGFEKCIDIWGADHHGHVKRLKNALGDLGVDPAKLDIVLMQLVRLVRDGQVVKMSKRTGKALQLEDLMDEVNVDSARFLFNMRESKSQMDFDLDLAVKQDSENPVYYVQYAHARICSIIKKLEEAGITLNKCSTEGLYLLNKPEEIELIHHLGLYTGEIIKSASSYDPTNITKYVISLANLFHRYYSACRVQCEDKDLMQARLALCASTKIVIRNVLKMFKISYPEKM